MTAKFPVKLGARVFRFLYENFLFHDFSLQNFARGLQVLYHFKDGKLLFLTIILKIFLFSFFNNFIGQSLYVEK